MTTLPESLLRKKSTSTARITTTPAIRRFIIVFSFVEAVMIGWALLSPHLR